MSDLVSDIRYSHLAYVALNVSDVAASAAYYESIVGLTPVPDARPGQAMFRCSDQHHDLLLVESATPGLKRLGWRMESPSACRAAFEHFAAAGLDPRRVDPREAKALAISEDAFRISEPNCGAIFEFFSGMEAAEAAFSPTVANIVRLGHVVISVTDLAPIERFCIEHLNFRVSDRIEGASTFFRCFPNPLHHSLAISKASANQLHHMNFMVGEVDDIGRAIHRLKKNGVPIMFGPGRHPPSNSIFLYFADPDGISVEYSLGMEEFPEVGARDARLMPKGIESIDTWGAVRDADHPPRGVIETATAP